MIRAVVFDLDGVLIESENLWDAARRKVAPNTAGAGATTPRPRCRA
jgi:beta-phosphoglucomutase-like phosphatase (HAD superfamily)